MFKRFAARLVTSPFAVFVSWTIDLAILLSDLRRQRRSIQLNDTRRPSGRI